MDDRTLGERTSPSDSENLYVVTENGEQCFMWRSNQLTYLAQDRQELPLVLAQKFGHLATKLDLSYNSLTSFKNINLFTNLNELVLDNNCLEDEQLEFKQNLRLKTLSLNKNRLLDLCKLIKTIKFSFPNLEFLSLIGNPLCPSSIVPWQQQPQQRQQVFENSNGAQKTFDCAHLNELIEDRDPIGAPTLLAEDHSFRHKKYRHFIIYHLPNLRFLDSRPITDQERDEALRRCFWMNNDRHFSRTPSDNSSCSWPKGTTGSSIEGLSEERHFQLTIMTSDQDWAEQPKGEFVIGNPK